MEQEFIKRFEYDQDQYKLVLDYFVYILNNNFIMALTYFSQGISYGYDYTGIEFAYNEETKEKVIIFYDFDYEINADIKMFINCLKIACEIFINYNLDSKIEIEKLFKATCDILISMY